KRGSMSPTHKEYVFDFEDLKLISVVCKGKNGACGAEVIVDISDAENKVPTQCPSCGQTFDAMFNSALGSFQSAYNNFVKGGKSATARLRIRRPVNVAEF